MTGKEGYCFATNKYFSKLYNVIPGTISRWINHLEDLGFIEVEIIRNDKKQVLERRIYIKDNYREFIRNTYEQNKQYPYEQNSIYPISENAKNNNINIKIDRFFNYIINNSGNNPEDMKENQESQFYELLEKVEFNYTKELLEMYTEENIDKIKIIIYALKELLMSNRNILISKVTRAKLLAVYDTCKEIQKESQFTNRRINNFFEYYYISLIRELEKAT